MPLYVYGCSQGHRTEWIRPVGTSDADCGTCEERHCPRVYQYSVAITQPEVDTRGLFRRFQEASSEMDYAAGRVEAATGQQVESPRLWQHAKARAAAMSRAGENPVARRQW